MAIETKMVANFAINFVRILPDPYVGAWLTLLHRNLRRWYEPCEGLVHIACENLQSFSLNNISETLPVCHVNFTLDYFHVEDLRKTVP
jgi:hypothetical protein